MASEPGTPTYEDFKGMLAVFRIPELQALLSSCGRCRTGRKQELLQRAFNLIRPAHESSLTRKAKARILELYRLRYPENNCHQTHTTAPYQPPYSKEDKILSPKRASYAMPKMDTAPRLNVSKSTSAVPVHPDVMFRQLPFYELIDGLVKPTSLVQKSLTGYQQMHVGFHLTPHQVQRISHARSYSIQGKVEYSMQVVLRFCLAETSCVQDDLYPPRLSVVVNGTSCQLPGQPPSGNHNLEPKKPHRPINITHFCRLSPMSAEQLRITWLPSDMGQRFTATVELIKIISPSALIQKLKAKAERNADHSRALIKEKLVHDPDSEIATTSLKVSLSCPIGRSKMMYPCRASTCNHVQCFDAALYIQMNERKPSWICPVCDQKAFYEQLVIDGLFTEIVRSAPDADEIVFSQDGSWKPLSDTNESESKYTKGLTDTISLSPGTPDTGRQRDNPTERRSEVEVIDLLSDSDDDDGEIRSSHTASSNSESSSKIIYFGGGNPSLLEPPPLVSASSCLYHDPSGQPTHEKGKGPRFRHVPHINTEALPEPEYYNQSLIDLYSILPPADRIAAAQYLNQAGLLGNGESSSDIISLD